MPRFLSHRAEAPSPAAARGCLTPKGEGEWSLPQLAALSLFLCHFSVLSGGPKAIKRAPRVPDIQAWKAGLKMFGEKFDILEISVDR